jgi:hypothetical protein
MIVDNGFMIGSWINVSGSIQGKYVGISIIGLRGVFRAKAMMWK